MAVKDIAASRWKVLGNGLVLIVLFSFCLLSSSDSFLLVTLHV